MQWIYTERSDGKSVFEQNDIRDNWGLGCWSRCILTRPQDILQKPMLRRLVPAVSVYRLQPGQPEVDDQICWWPHKPVVPAGPAWRAATESKQGLRIFLAENLVTEQRAACSDGVIVPACLPGCRETAARRIFPMRCSGPHSPHSPYSALIIFLF